MQIDWRVKGMWANCSIITKQIVKWQVQVWACPICSLCNKSCLIVMLLDCTSFIMHQFAPLPIISQEKTGLDTLDSWIIWMAVCKLWIWEFFIQNLGNSSPSQTFSIEVITWTESCSGLWKWSCTDMTLFSDFTWRKSKQNLNVSFTNYLETACIVSYSTQVALVYQFHFWQWVVTMNTFLIIEWFVGHRPSQQNVAPWQQSGLQLISEYFGTKGWLQVCAALIIDLFKAATWTMFGKWFVNYLSKSSSIFPVGVRKRQKNWSKCLCTILMHIIFSHARAMDLGISTTVEWISMKCTPGILVSRQCILITFLQHWHEVDIFDWQ